METTTSKDSVFNDTMNLTGTVCGVARCAPGQSCVKQFLIRDESRIGIYVQYVIYESSVATRWQSAMPADRKTPDMILEHNRKYVSSMKHITI